MGHCGALLGLAIGDALGTTHEFKSIGAPAFPTLASGPLREIVGGGPFGLAPGQVTDDTQMACCLYSSLKQSDGFDAADVAARYVAWSRVAFDIGTQTARAISLLRSGVAPLEAGRTVWIESLRRAAGNGSLMRTAPIGVLLADSADARRRAALDDSALTHYDPRCRLACAGLDAAIAEGTRGVADANQLWQAAFDEVSVAGAVIAPEYDRETLDEATSALLTDLRMANESDPELYGPLLHLHRNQGFVRIAFRLAFWELLHAPTYEAAVLDVANRGGDADTNAAITGALVGSLVGPSGIPTRWQRTVLECSADGSEAWARSYHPRMFECA